MIRRPPRSTLFPYRRSSDLNVREEVQLARGEWLQEARHEQHEVGARHEAAGDLLLHALDGVGAGRRSEEHTSELQSRLHLVCRLLLEKKKKQKHRHR